MITKADGEASQEYMHLRESPLHNVIIYCVLPEKKVSGRIVDLCGKSSGFADFENTVDCGSALIFDVVSGLCLSYVWNLVPKRNLDHRFFFSLDRYVNEFFRFSKEVCLKTGVRQLLELYCVFVIRHVASFTLWAKLTLALTPVALTCTSLPLNLVYSDVVLVSDLNKNFG